MPVASALQGEKGEGREVRSDVFTVHLIFGTNCMVDIAVVPMSVYLKLLEPMLYAGGAREGGEGHSGGGGPSVGRQNVLLLPGPSQPLPHHGVPARRYHRSYCFVYIIVPPIQSDVSLFCYPTLKSKQRLE
jgi:hypothetical protein